MQHHELQYQLCYLPVGSTGFVKFRATWERAARGGNMTRAVWARLSGGAWWEVACGYRTVYDVVRGRRVRNRICRVFDIALIFRVDYCILRVEGARASQT